MIGAIDEAKRPAAKSQAAAERPCILRFSSLSNFRGQDGCRAIVAETRADRSECCPTGSIAWRRWRPEFSPTQTEADGEVYVAVDEGVLVKTGAMCSSPCAMRSAEPIWPAARGGETEFLTLDDTRAKRANGHPKLESGFVDASRSFNMMSRQSTEDERGVRRTGWRRPPASCGRNAKRRRHLVWPRHVGIIGWSVAVPTLLGALLGLWLDDRLIRAPTPGR